MWTGMPPLVSLRAFACAARHRSFTLAARELGVTHAAVAQQVRALEAHLDLQLMVREGRHVALTPAGATLAKGLDEGFGIVTRAVRQAVDDRTGRPLQVTLTPAFANDWLMPRLGGFWATHPDIPIALHPTRRNMDLGREGMDLAIRFGNRAWPGLHAEMLVAAPFVVIAAPSLVAGRALTRADLQAMRWVVEAEWTEQKRWLSNQGFDVDALALTTVPSEDLAMTACRNGYGLTVQAHPLVQEDVAAGRLAIVFTADPGRDGYYIVTLPGRSSPQVRQFVRWLKSVA